MESSKVKHPSTVSKHSSSDPNHISPFDITLSARDLMGGVISLDPASCKEANRSVGARRYFTPEENGLSRRWSGRVWLNPPGGICDAEGRLVIRSTAPKGKPPNGCTTTGACGLPAPHTHHGLDSAPKRWWEKLTHDWSRGWVECGLFLAFSIEFLQVTQKNLKGPPPTKFPVCIFQDRIDFLKVDETGELVPETSPTHASAVVWVPPKTASFAASVSAFAKYFGKYGAIVVPAP